jgi:hypothetical protein
MPHHAKSLGVLVNRNMTDAKERCALPQDVDRRTFVRFSQYAYTGDYVAANPDVLLDSSTITSTHYFPNETSIEIDDDEALSPPPSSPDYAQPEPELEPTRDLAVFSNSNDGWGDWSMSEKDKKKWRNREKRRDELEDITPKAEEPAAVAPRSTKSEL